MIPGNEIELYGKKYIVAPLNFKTLIKISPLLESLQALAKKPIPSEEDFTNCVTILHAALLRNYPDITFDEVAENLDVVNIHPIMNQIMAAAGAANMGEAKAGSQ